MDHSTLWIGGSLHKLVHQLSKNLEDPSLYEEFLAEGGSQAVGLSDWCRACAAERDSLDWIVEDK